MNENETAPEVSEVPTRPGPKPGNAARRKAEAEATRQHLAHLQEMIGLLTTTFPGLLSGNNAESMSREIFIRSMVAAIGDSDADGFIKFEDPASDARVREFYIDTARAVRSASLIAAHTFYADPATE